MTGGLRASAIIRRGQDIEEDIQAWQKGRSLAQGVYQVTSLASFDRDFKLRDQMRAAAASVPSNVAEGFGRGGNGEFRQFLSIAKGSVTELKAHLSTALDAGYVDQGQFDSLYGLANDAEHLIGGFMRYLSRSNFRGAKLK